MLATFQLGEVLWSMLFFFLWFMWLMLLFHIFADVFRDHAMSGLTKTLWIIFVILTPFLGVFVYLIARGGKMAENQANAMAAMQQAQQEYIRQAAGTASSPAEEIARLVELKQQGAIDEAEFQTLKAKALA